MAAILNRIANHFFVMLEGVPTPPIEHIEVLPPRPGVDGHAFRKLGAKGRPFVLRSGVDAVSVFAAHVLIGEHQSLTDIGPVELYQHNTQLTGALRVKVLSVTATVVRNVGLIVGGVNVVTGNSGTWLEEQWTMITVDTTL